MAVIEMPSLRMLSHLRLPTLNRVMKASAVLSKEPGDHQARGASSPSCLRE